MRTDYCGTLRPEHEGQRVAVCGWVNARREHGEHLAFVDLRDRTGVIQCVVDGAADLRVGVRAAHRGHRRPARGRSGSTPSSPPARSSCTTARSRSSRRPSRRRSRSTAATTSTRTPASGTATSTCAARSSSATSSSGPRVNSAVRGAMERQGFTEIETPMLIASTPEGARDFVVPSRLHPGSFYALPQSPQLFKQLCMVGGMDRYFQIARCLRDEDLRADRQFEFMQLDAEASFVTADEVMAFISEAVLDAAEAVRGERPGTIGSITWHEAMERYGSDKPDVRFGLELVELTEVFAATEFKAFQADCIKGIRVPGAAADTTRKRLDELTERCKSWGAKGLVWIRVGEGGELDSPVAKFFSPDEAAALVAAMEAEPGDLVFVVADKRRTGASRARPAAQRAGSAAGRRGRPVLPLGRRLPALRGRGRRLAGARPPPVHHAAPRRRRPARGPGRAGDRAACSTSARRPTTSPSTGGSSARAACGSTAATSSARCSSCSASATRSSS